MFDAAPAAWLAADFEPARHQTADWIVVQELKFSYHTSETVLFTVYPSNGTFLYLPELQPSRESQVVQ